MTNTIQNAASQIIPQQNGHMLPMSPDGNVGEQERLWSLAGGLALAAFGITSRGPTQILLPLVGGMLAYRGLTGHCSVYKSLGVDTTEKSPATAVRAGTGFKVERAVTINKPASELYQFWRKLETLPRFMKHLKQVRVLDNHRSHWVAQAPLGMTVEWDAEIFNDEPNHLIAWRSLPNSKIATAGSVRFLPAPAGRGTEIHVSMKYDPPGGKLGASLAKLFGESPDEQVRADLLQLKQMMEVGEIATVQGQPSGREAGRRA